MTKKTSDEVLEDIRWLISIVQKITEYPIDRKRLERIRDRYE